MLMTKQVDGIIFISAGDSGEVLTALKQAEIPTVVTDRDVQSGLADVVLLNNRLGGYLATRHLLELNHTKIACITGPQYLPSSMERIEGYYEALEEAGVSPNPDWVLTGDFRLPSGQSCMAQLLEVKEQPTAVFVCSDMMALGAMNAVHNRGMRIPEDISIVGFDNVTLASSINPALTTVAQPIQQIATIICEILFSRMQNADTEALPERIIIDPQLMIRSTTRALK
jgi:LacI family transcriptional regulator